MASPEAAITRETISGSHVKLALPTPSRMPATGRTETGSIMHLPIFCRSEKAVLKLSILVLGFRDERAYFCDGGALQGPPRKALASR